MANRKNRYQQLERYLTYALILDGILFVLYLLFAGLGIVWLKAIIAILALLLSGLCLYLLYATNELLRQRSLWMSLSAASIILCTLFSLLLNYPGV